MLKFGYCIELVQPSLARCLRTPSGDASSMRWLLVLCVCVACHHDHPSTSFDASVPIDAAPAEVGSAVVALTVPFQPTTPTAYDFIVAYQDGVEPWTRAPPRVGDVFTLPITSDRYGVLVACSDAFPSFSKLRIVQIEYFTIAEATHVEIPLFGCGDPRALAHLHGTVSNLGATPSISVETGDSIHATSTGTAYELDLAAGTRDVVARTDIESPGRILVVHDVDEVNDTALDIDFTTAVAMSDHQVHGLTTSQGDVIDTRSLLETANGTSAILSATSTNQFVFTSSPASMHRPGDVDRLYAIVAASNSSAYRSLDVYGATGDVTATFRAPIAGLACATGTAAPTPRVHATWTPLTTDITMVSVVQEDQLTNEMLEINAAMTTGYRGTASTWDAPDPSTIVDWPHGYDVTAGTIANCMLHVEDSSTGPGELATVHHVAGTIMLGATAGVAYTP